MHNKVAEDYWWAVLGAESGSRKPKYLRALCPTIRNALDSLLPITGIWEGLRIGVLHKINAMKCQEVSHARKATMRGQKELSLTTISTAHQLLPREYQTNIHVYRSR